MASKTPKPDETAEVEDVVVETPEVEEQAEEEAAEKPTGRRLTSKQVASNKAAIKAAEKAEADRNKQNRKAGIVAHIELLKGVQFHDHQANVLYRREHLTPVTEISSWALRQEGHGLLKIHRIAE